MLKKDEEDKPPNKRSIFQQEKKLGIPISVQKEAGNSHFPLEGCAESAGIPLGIPPGTEEVSISMREELRECRGLSFSHRD